MEIYDKLKKRHEDGKTIKNGLVGCGQMGSGLVHVTRRMIGLETYAIADIDPQRPKDVLKKLGVDPQNIVVTNKKSQAEDVIRNGKYLITEDALLLPKLDGLDAVVEATGVTEIGAKVAWEGIMNDKNIIMLNVETDVTVGVILDRVSRRGKGIYTVAAGDEPAVCKMLYDFSSTLGFEVVCLGKGKNNPLDYEANPENCLEEARSKGMNPKMLASFKDGTKTMVEMAAVSNATGLIPDVIGMHGPKVELDDLKKIFIPKRDGGILSKKGCVEYSTGKIAPGVFAVVYSEEDRINTDLNFMSMGKGPYYMFYRPYHLCNIETPQAIIEAVLYGERTVTAKSMYSEVLSVAKRDLSVGDIIGSIGSKDILNKIYTYDEAKQLKGIPMGIASGSKVQKPIKKGELLNEDNCAPDTSTFIYQLRKMQDSMLINGN